MKFLIELAISTGMVLLLAAPLAISVWALLDAARRPRWVWAFTGRSQVVWMSIIMFGILTIIIGIIVSLIYLVKIRPQLAAVEKGDFGGPDGLQGLQPST